MDPVPQWSNDETQAAVAAGALLLDVREQDEWDAAHVPTATHLPMSQIGARADEVPRDRAIAVMCATGRRSQQVAAWLRSQGIDAANVANGIHGWHAAGLPVEFGR